MPTAVLPPGLDALLRAARAPSYESPYPGFEGISPEEMAIAGMPGVSDIMLKREAMAGQRAGLGGQHALGVSELAEQSLARQIADSISQERLGLDWDSLSSRHSLGTQELGLRGGELEQRTQQDQARNILDQMKLGLDARGLSQRDELGRRGMELKARELEQSYIPDLMKSIGMFEEGRGRGAMNDLRAKLMAQNMGLTDGAAGGQPPAAPADSSSGLFNALIAAAVAAGAWKLGGGALVKGALGKAKGGMKGLKGTWDEAGKAAPGAAEAAPAAAPAQAAQAAGGVDIYTDDMAKSLQQMLNPQQAQGQIPMEELIRRLQGFGGP